MTSRAIIRRFPNALVVVSDCNGGETPPVGPGLASLGKGCLLIGCRPDADGPTRVHVTSNSPDRDDLPALDIELDTPSGSLAVETVFRESLIVMPVFSEKTRLFIWANDPMEPDDLEIYIMASGMEQLPRH